MRKYLLLSATFFFVMSTVHISEAQVSLLKDINPNGNIDNETSSQGGSVSNYPADRYIIHNNIMFFTANNGVQGEELWRTDGTTSGTYLVKDINSGPSSSTPREFTLAGGTIYFSAETANDGRELWRTDGTESGTYMVKDICPGNCDGLPEQLSEQRSRLTEFQGKVYFFAKTVNSGLEIWSSNGTQSGTNAVTTSMDAGINGIRQHLFVWNNWLIFTIQDNQIGYELWKTDGTNAGTTLIRDINPSGDGHPHDFHIFNNGFIFSADDGVNGYEIWYSQGTNSSTQRISDTQGIYSDLFVVNGKILFESPNPIDGFRELWVSQGTLATTQMLLEINQGQYYNGCELEHGFIHNNRLYFEGNDGLNSSNEEPWSSDGTASGTQLVADLGAYQGFPEYFGSKPSHIVVFNNNAYFRGRPNELTGMELMQLNLTTGTGGIVADINQGTEGSWAQPLGIISGKLIFVADDGTHGNELWVYTPLITAVQAMDYQNLQPFPNPNSGIFQIEIPNGMSLNKVQLIDLSGRILEIQTTHQSNTLTIDCGAITSGIYMLLLQEENSLQMIAKKVIVQ